MRTATALLASLTLGAALTAGHTTATELPTTRSSAACDTDTNCAWHDTRTAQDGYGIPVWAGTPHVTPHVTEARHGQYIELSCDTGRDLARTDDGWACLEVTI